VRPNRGLFPPEYLRQPISGRNHIVEGDHLVPGDRSTQSATFGESDRKGGHLAGCGCIVNEPIGAKPSDPIEDLAGFEIALGHGHYFTDWARQG